MTTLANLRSLHSTIGAALDDIERIYRTCNLDFPSLDTPFYDHQRAEPTAADNGSHPLKSNEGSKQEIEAEKLSRAPDVVNAVNLIVAACGQLATSVQLPFYVLAESVHLGHITAALSFLEASHTVDILREAGSQGMHVVELARKIEEVHLGKDATSATGARRLDPAKLSHILRLLATIHWMREVKPDVFANNRISSAIDSGKSSAELRDSPESKYQNTNGGAAFIGMSTDDVFRSITYLREWLLPSKDDRTDAATPFNLAFNTEEGYYSWLERPENAGRLARASCGMGVARIVEGGLSIADKSVYPWDTLPQNAVVVDVGGGIGSVSVRLAEPYPNLRLIVQDLQKTIALAPKARIWGSKHKELFDSGRVSYQVQDFFQPQPPTLNVPGVGAVQYPAAYIITRVLHNWPDAQCIEILKNLRAAAGPDTKLIIHEMILPLACEDPSAEDAARETGLSDVTSSLAPKDSPLLPNLGKATAGQYQFDLTMMTLMNSKERTLKEMCELTKTAGWRIVKAARVPPPVTWGWMVAVPN
ncbi:S-adenosyl-L-methionine-dependent methyltransferase [Trametes coccinea BRFM310]|uniref:S-adenosyl-L-methionine-dependent methyltransferase n=1 Tax=Trametes coccinea (strain BRFM310) TaxID=1353009 RepID=A0A1Y2I793_TRAC3|nr:S-adenosyl-L-methionine-dependent methyltransferase [Trametes coccinea BRFM310]